MLYHLPRLVPALILDKVTKNKKIEKIVEELNTKFMT
jgi:hypothetical protein